MAGIHTSKSVRKNFSNIFNFKDDLGKGRSCMLISTVIVSIINYLTSGIFYNAFLLANGIDILKIAILSFVPFIANVFSIFSPMILERFEKRKWILISGKFIYYFLNIFCITFLPTVLRDAPENVKLNAFLIIILAANICNALVASGFTAWQVVFIPNNVRADFFGYSQTFAAAIAGVTIVISSLVTDAVNGSAHYNLVLEIIRLVAFLFALFDLFLNAMPKEYPYAETSKTKFGKIFTVPVRNKAFMVTMLFVAIWQFNYNMVNSFLYSHLLKNCNVKLTFVNTIDALYAVFLLLLSGFWKKKIAKYSWLKVFAFTCLCHVPTTIMYAMVNGSNYWWLMSTVRFFQHIFGVGLNITYANMVYLNMPEEDRTCYVSFYTLVFNIFSCAGILLGTFIVKSIGDATLNILGVSFMPVPFLQLIQAAGQLLLPLLIWKLLPIAEPKEQ